MILRVKPCLWPRCPDYALSGSSYCAQHVKQRSQLGLTGGKRSNEFHRNRRIVMRKQHGVCACGARATDVHHIGSVDDDRVENLIALCDRCHRKAGRRTPPRSRSRFWA